MKSGVYRIGMVSRLTGVPPETLRSWEARHGLVKPRRTPGGFRLYDDADVECIGLVRALTQLGHPVGTLAGLDLAELRRRAPVEPARDVPGGTTSRAPKETTSGRPRDATSPADSPADAIRDALRLVDSVTRRTGGGGDAHLRVARVHLERALEALD